MPGLGQILARATVAVFVWVLGFDSVDAYARQELSNNPCDHDLPDDVTCAMGMEEVCKGSFSLWAMYASKLGTPPDTDMVCCAATVFSSECVGVWCVLVPYR